MQNKTQGKSIMAQIHHRAWSDPDFQKQLQDDPHMALETYFGPINNIEIRVVQDSEKTKYLHVPSPPPQGEVSDLDLTQAQGGTTPLCGPAIITVLSLVSVAATATPQA